MNPWYHDAGFVQKPRLMPLGFWFQPEWPSTSFIPYCKADPVILNSPPINRGSLFYPIPASLYQNVQEENFWAVAVRQLGTEVLVLRSVKAAEEYTYDPATKINRTRIISRDLFPNKKLEALRE